jgi:hypothetical protein
VKIRAELLSANNKNRTLTKKNTDLEKELAGVKEKFVLADKNFKDSIRKRNDMQGEEIK